MDRFESELKMQELNNQRDLVNAIKDLVVVQGMMLKANGLARLSSNKILEDIIQRNLT